MVRANVFSTKKLEPSLVEMVKEQGIAVVEQEAIQIQPIFTKEKRNEIVSLLEKKIPYAVFTSSNAVSSLKKYFHTDVSPLPVQWKIFCISGKTKEWIQENEALFGTVVGTAAYGTQLAEQIIHRGVKELVFFCGNRRRDELPSILQAAGVQVHEVVVYETIETPVTAPENFDAVLFFSPSAVQSFFTVNQLKEAAVCFAIGHTTADSIAGFTKNKIIVSNAPTQKALLNEVINYFQTR